MILIKKNNIEIKCQTADSWEEVSELICNAFIDWNQNVKKEVQAEFVDDLPMIPTITFILGTITSGFLKQIGEEIWGNLRQTISNKLPNKQKPNFKLHFNYEGISFVVEVKHNDLQTLESVLNNLDTIIQGISTNEESEVKFVLGENGKFKRKF